MNAPAQPLFKVAVFDMDGLLLDSERPIRDAWLVAAQSLGVALDGADYLTVVGLNHTDSRARMLALFGGDADRLAAAHAQVEMHLAERFGRLAFDIKPGARRLLQALQAADIHCAVASSTHRVELLHRLGKADMTHFFEAVCGGDEVANGKPAPDLYLLALERLGADASRSLAFEDSGHGVRAALAAGLAVVNVPDLKPPDASLQALCLAVVPTLNAVLERKFEWFGIQCA
jgi:HAD superfamily hydrolase (TIGR01509 family)